VAPPPSGSRPGRTLLILAAVIVAMVATMFATGATKPRLGLDLQGGTSVILQPRLTTGGDVSDTALREAVNIIRQRVNGLGVTEADVQTQGRNIVVSVPGATNQEAVELIASTAQMRFRPVLSVTAGAPIPDPTAEPTPAPTDGATPDPEATGEPADAPTGESVAPNDDDSEATPAPTSSPAQSRAVPAALKRSATIPVPDPAAPATEAPPATPPVETPPVEVPPAGEEMPAELQEQFAALDCTKAENRQGGGDLPADEPIVACDRDGVAKYILGPTAVEGTTIDDATAGIPQNTTQWVVNLEFDGEGTQQFRDVTTRLQPLPEPQNQFAIVLDNVVVSAPRVNDPITNGQAEISGDFTQAEAQDLANVLRYGALPITFDQGEVNTISASVGEDQLDKGILAGLVGLLLVVIYSLLFYRALGIVSILSLIIAGVLTYASVSLLADAIGFALILPGVIGVIVAIGITADSFVVFFERLRDEIREGRSIRVAVESAWVRARRTILVADAVTFMAAVILYFLSIGRVANFAFTLGLTTLIDVIVVFLFTKPLVTYLVRRDFFAKGHPLSGLNRESIGASAVRPRAGRPATAATMTARTTKEA
jgi:preprotein translocase subunit SecD